MAGESILVVEDELIVAQDLQDMLRHLGYRIAGSAATGEEAIEKSAATRPDLVLMDIRLKGLIDGIEAAAAIWSRYEIPVTYLTAYADESTLERAKATMPFGYILKPFEERDLRTSIEIALYKHSMESVLGKMDNWYVSALDSLADAIMATNIQGGLTFMNPAAESLTGWSLREIYGKNIEDIVQTACGQQQASVQTKDGRRLLAEVTLTPIKEKDGRVTGQLAVVHQSARQAEPSNR